MKERYLAAGLHANDSSAEGWRGFHPTLAREQAVCRVVDLLNSNL
jgi:hypothetical protein